MTKNFLCLFSNKRMWELLGTLRSRWTLYFSEVMLSWDQSIEMSLFPLEVGPARLRLCRSGERLTGLSHRQHLCRQQLYLNAPEYVGSLALPGPGGPRGPGRARLPNVFWSLVHFKQKCLLEEFHNQWINHNAVDPKGDFGIFRKGDGPLPTYLDPPLC